MAGKAYWQAKIWGLLHDPALKALYKNSGRGDEGFWTKLACMEGWVSPKDIPSGDENQLSVEWLKHVGLSDLISSASDRGIIHYIGTSVDYGTEGLELSHLLSGDKLRLQLKNHDEIVGQGDRRTYLKQQEEDFIDQIPSEIRQDAQACFWWLWRCLPEAVAEQFGAESHLMPAETRLPDGSIWSHASMTSAIAGALAGYDTEHEDIPKGGKNAPKSHPHLAVFTFSPVQELIKASRKMKDFWAGSWILHYLSAKVCWRLAHKYGADCFLYPSLYGQPLIDHWLINKYPKFQKIADKGWIKKPEDRQLLTAGFPNVIMLILPEEKVAAAMQSAKNHLLDAWREIAEEVLAELQENRHWQKKLKDTDPTWKDWLDAQWQTYWSAVAIGAKGSDFKSVGIPTQTPEKKQDLDKWVAQQNEAFNAKLFNDAEKKFFMAATEKFTDQRNRSYAGSLNAGSWWADIFRQTRLALNSVKNARNWKLPTAFGTRSTISGIGSVVHPQGSGNHRDWLTEGESQHYWGRHAGLFDGIEQLNATETVKRGLEKVLPKLLDRDPKELKAYYPDLTVGVAGYLKTQSEKDGEALAKYKNACSVIKKKITKDHHEIAEFVRQEWGIPWIDETEDPFFKNLSHPRLLNAGWLVEELENLNKENQKNYRQELQEELQNFYPNNNPASWYAIAAGDGDGMSDWLKGSKMEEYKDYFAPELLKKLADKKEEDKGFYQKFEKFSEVRKRMGPATHNALSRALLDFSNQLAPYLTEERYAGRLIYSGGDDVLAYTNLWEWDKWLWDIRQAFKGQKDNHQEFERQGDYWRYTGNNPRLTQKFDRPLFTMGKNATISFGLVIAHHSVPLAIALENLWKAEEKAKEHEYFTGHYHPENKYPCYAKKDAVQVRAIYGNGNILTATCKFKVFQIWRDLLEEFQELDASLFEQAAQILEDHPIPIYEAIDPWVKAFGDRREQLKKINSEKAKDFSEKLIKWIQETWKTNQIDPDRSKNDQEKALKQRDQELKNWLKLAAFNLRNRCC